MTVDEMLARMSAPELTAWEAYEQAHGPLGTAYSNDMLAGIHELLQAVLIALGGAEEGTQVFHQPRPHQVFEFLRDREAGQERAEEAPLQTQLDQFNDAMDGKSSV